MFAAYVYKAGATGAQVCADLVALIGGGRVAALSAACDRARMAGALCVGRVG